MAEQDSLKTSMAALALALESAVAGVGDLPALAQIFAAATGGGENACGKARLGLCHGGKKGERRYDCPPKPEECHEGSVRMHCLRNFWGAEGGNSNLCCGNPPARRRCSESGKGGRCWRTPTCRQRPRGPTRTGDKRVGKDAGTQSAYAFAGGGWRGPSAGAGRPAARNPLRPGARAGRLEGPAAWGRRRPCQLE
jgi:hypothetical protein